MEHVNIVIMSTDKVLVGDVRDRDYLQWHSADGPTCVVENNPMLRVDPYSNIERIDHLKIMEFKKVRNGIETRKLLAVTPEVYEELYSIPDDTVRDEVLRNHKSKIESLEGMHKLQVKHLNKLVEDLDCEIENLKAATFLTRLSWLFKGVGK